MSSAPFGVDLPQSFGQPSDNASSSNTSVAPESSSPSPSNYSSEPVTSEAPKASDILDLDKLERFRLDGKEWSRQDVLKSIMRHEDYTKKTMAVAEARKYAENFEVDIAKVMENPELLDNFKGIYPRFYVDLAQRLLSKVNGQNPQNGQSVQQPSQNDPYAKRFESLESKIQQYEQQTYDAEVAKIGSWIDKTYDGLSKKYPFADAELVTSRATTLRDQGHDVDEKVLEKLFKQTDQSIREKFEKTYQTKVKEQLSANKRGKDIGAGGGVPGSAPFKAKSMKDARSALLSQFK